MKIAKFYCFLFISLLSSTSLVAQANNELFSSNELKNIFIKSVYPDVEFRNNDKLCIVPEKGKFSSRVFIECDVLIQHLISHVLDLGNLSGEGFSFLSKPAYNSLLKYYLSLIDSNTLKEASDLNQLSIAKLLYVLIEIQKVVDDSEFLFKVKNSVLDKTKILDHIFMNLGNEEIISKLGTSLVLFYEKNINEVGEISLESTLFFHKLVLAYGTNEQFQNVLFESINFSNHNFLPNLKVLKQYLDDNALETKSQSSELLNKLILCSNDFHNKNYITECNFLENYPKLIIENFANMYIERGILLSKNNSFEETFNYFDLAPSFFINTDSFGVFYKNILPNLFDETKLSKENIIKVCTLIKTENECRESYDEKQKKFELTSLLKYFFAFIVLLLLAGIFILRYFLFKTKEKKESLIIQDCLTAEERTELRELRSFFMLRPNSGLAELAKNYRKKVKVIHPDTLNGSDTEFLLLQEKHARIKVLLSRLNEEKENRITEAENFFRY